MKRINLLLKQIEKPRKVAMVGVPADERVQV